MRKHALAALVLLLVSLPSTATEPVPAELIAASCPVEWRDQANRLHRARLDPDADWLVYIPPSGRELTPNRGLGHVPLVGSMWETYRRRYGLPESPAAFESWAAPNSNVEHQYGIRDSLLTAHEQGRITQPSVQSWIDAQATWSCFGPRIGVDTRATRGPGISGPRFVDVGTLANYCVSGLRGGGPRGDWYIDGVPTAGGRGACLAHRWQEPGERVVEYRKGRARPEIQVLVIGVASDPAPDDPPDPGPEPEPDPQPASPCADARSALEELTVALQKLCGGA